MHVEYFTKSKIHRSKLYKKWFALTLYMYINKSSVCQVIFFVKFRDINHSLRKSRDKQEVSLFNPNHALFTRSCR